MNEINERIREVFDYYRISTISEFARITGISHQSAYNYLKLGKFPSTKSLQKIHKSFKELNLDWLLTGKGQMIRNDKQTISIKSKKVFPSMNPTILTGSERVKKVMNYYSLNKNIFSKEIGMSNNVTIGRIVNNKANPTMKIINRISTRFPEINPDWLLTGRGEMLRKEPDSQSSLSKVPQLRYDQLQASTQSLNYKGRGVPFYDVDFIGGFQYIFNDQTTQPFSYIDVPIFNEADAWVNVSGDSMKPLINSGDIVAIKKLINWSEFILYGKVYGIVTEDFRTIKIIKEEEEGYFLLIPYNQSQEFKAQRIPKNLIMHIFKVIGCLKRIF